MDQPLEISFKGIDPVSRAETVIREKFDHVQKIFSGIVSCRVVLDAPHKRHQTGNLFGVRIEMHLPGQVLVVDHHKGDVAAHEHPEVAVRDAFAAMERQLKQWKDKVRHEVKHHEGALQGEVAEIDHPAGFGQIRTTDQRLVYFHQNSVVDGTFKELQVHDPVELVVQTHESAIGPQASTVRPISRMRYKAS